MYIVGMGQSPAVPEELSEEGKNFLDVCFVHNPEERATAQDLLGHNFTKVNSLVLQLGTLNKTKSLLDVTD